MLYPKATLLTKITSDSSTLELARADPIGVEDLTSIAHTSYLKWNEDAVFRSKNDTENFDG